MSDANRERTSKGSKNNSVSETKVLLWKVSISKGVGNTTKTCGITLLRRQAER